MKVILTLVSMVLVLSLSCMSCLDKNVDNTKTPVSLISIYQASPDSPVQNVLVNLSIYNASPMQFTSYLPYNQITPGMQNFKFVNASNSAILIDSTVSFVDGSAYTLYAIGTSAKREMLVTTDYGKLSSLGNCALRFVHLSPDAPAVDIQLVGSSVKLFTSQSYKDSTPYAELGFNTYTIEVRASSDGRLLVSVPFSPEPAVFYSLHLVGFATPPAGNSNVLAGKLVNNK